MNRKRRLGIKTRKETVKDLAKRKRKERGEKNKLKEQKPGSFSEKGPDGTVNVLKLEFQMSHVGKGLS